MCPPILTSHKLPWIPTQRACTSLPPRPYIIAAAAVFMPPSHARASLIKFGSQPSPALDRKKLSMCRLPPTTLDGPRQRHVMTVFFSTAKAHSSSSFHYTSPPSITLSSSSRDKNKKQHHTISCRLLHITISHLVFAALCSAQFLGSITSRSSECPPVSSHMPLVDPGHTSTFFTSSYILQKQRTQFSLLHHYGIRILALDPSLAPSVQKTLLPSRV